MPKLHEVLAVEGDLEGIFKKIIEESIVVFKKKPDLFTGSLRTYEPFDEEEKDKVAAYEERHEITTTVPERMEYTFNAIVDYLDILATKDITNKSAKANLVVDGVTIASDLPATLLLTLEQKFKIIRNVFDSMPTLPPGHNWEVDQNEGEHIFRLEPPERKFKTAKTFEHKVLYAATDKHPAQIKEWEEVKNVGEYITNRWNGMVTSAQKAVMLRKMDKLIQATKKARQKANCEEVVETKIGEVVRDYLLK